MTESAEGVVRVTLRDAGLLAKAAGQLEPQVGTVARKMVEAFAAEIPAYATITDASLLDDVHTVSMTVVRCWLTVMASGRPLDQELLTPLREGARRRAVQGVDVDSVLRAYRIGVRVMWSEIIASPACRSGALQSDLTRASTWLLDFADRVSAEVAAAYAEEAARVSHEWERRRSGLFNAILSGHAPEQRHGPEELEGRHCVVVAKVSPSLSLARLEETGRLLERRAGVMLWTVRHCSVVTAVGLPGGDDRDQLRQRLAGLVDGEQILAFGLGDNAEGALETRQSYVEATDALEVGPQVTRVARPVHDYRDLAPMVALLAEPDRARRFVATALEPFSRLGHRKWMLPTVEAYLSRQGRLKEVAIALGVHQNTVKYRVNELRPILDRAVGDGEQAAALLVAIRIHEHLAGSAAGARSRAPEPAAEGDGSPETPPCDRGRRPPAHPGA